MKNSIIIACVLALFSVPTYAKDSPVRDAFKRSLQYEQSQNYNDAIRALVSINAGKQQAYNINLRMGWLYYLSGHYANSIKHYQIAIKLAPNAIEPLIGKLLPLLAQQHYQDVNLIAHKILRKDYNNYYANLRLIIALRLQRKYDLAQNTVKKMRALYPGDITFIEQDALVSEQSQRLEKASELYAKLLILDPENLAAKRFFGYMKLSDNH